MRKLAFIRSTEIAAPVFALIAVLSLAACGPAVSLSEEARQRGNQLRPPHEVEMTVHQHQVAFDPSRPAISEQERRRLYGFLAGAGARTGDRVLLASRRNRLAHRGQVERFVRALGLRPTTRWIKETEGDAAVEGYDTAIYVRYEHYVAIAPECGRWSEAVATGFYNTTPANFGCSTAANYSRQIAFPSSLIVGESAIFPAAGTGSTSGGSGSGSSALSVTGVTGGSAGDASGAAATGTSAVAAGS